MSQVSVASHPTRPRPYRLVGLISALAFALGGQRPASGSEASPDALAWTVSLAEYTSPYIPLVRRLLQDAGITAQFAVYPAERSRQMLISGAVQAEFFRQPAAVAELGSGMALIGPLVCVEVTAFVRTDSSVDAPTLEALKPYRVGVSRGNQLPLEAAQAAGLTVEVISPEALMPMLDKGRIDVALQTYRIGQQAIDKAGLSERLSQRGPMLVNRPSYLVIRRPLPPGAEARLQASADHLIKTGEWQRLFAAANKQQGLPAAAGLSCLAKPPRGDAKQGTSG